MGETEEFNTLTFEKKLMHLKDSQESIQALSSWCLKQREHHKKIVSSWLNVLKRVKVEQRLVLFYLANDVIQYSKRKNYEFVESWGLNLQKATPLVRDEKVRPKILRIFKIWEQRSVYDDEFLSDLTGLLSAGAIKKTDDDPLDFQPQQLVNKIKQCTVLESDTDLRLKYIHESHLQLTDADALCASLKDRSSKDDVEKELNEGIACVERYTQSLQREIVARETLLALLASANQYYSMQRGEVKVVAYAYKTFGARVRALKRKLDELIPTLPNAVPSPPQRDEDVPSPGPDEDLDLPNNVDNSEEDISYNIDQTFSTSLAADGSLYNLGLSSFLTSENPLSLFNDSEADLNNTNKIEVINNRPSEKQDFNINDFLKNFAPNGNINNTSDNISVASGIISQKSMDTLPGLDLLTPESTGNPPPTSFYGTIPIENIIGETDQPYIPESSTPWATLQNNWNLPPPRTSPLLPRNVFSDTPESPPPAPLPPPPSMPLVPVVPSIPAIPSIPSIPAISSIPGIAALSSIPSMPPIAAVAAIPPIANVPGVSTVSSMGRQDSYTQDLPSTDVDHRGILPPPPPPPVLPIISRIEDIDHRLLASLPPLPHTGTTSRHSISHQDVDHRNLISLTHQPTGNRNPHPIKGDQDYRVPTVSMPSDIVESVDMDLSEDEDHQVHYSSQPSQIVEHQRRHSFNNRVLVGGNGKASHKDQNHTNLIQISSTDSNRRDDGPKSAPVAPISNPFDHMPPALKFGMVESDGQYEVDRPLVQNQYEADRNRVQGQYQVDRSSQGQYEVNRASVQGQYEVDRTPVQGQYKVDRPPVQGQYKMDIPPNQGQYKMDIAPVQGQYKVDVPPPQNQYEAEMVRPPMMLDHEPYDRRGLDKCDIRNPAPSEYVNGEWPPPSPRPFGQRFPRNWQPRNPNFRPQNYPLQQQQQFWPRNGPRPPNRWMGPRPQRFW